MIWSKNLISTRYTKVLQRSHFIFITIIILLFHIGCQNEQKKSVLIIAVDQINPERYNCADEKNNEDSSGLAILCKESLRFTHAYTTSLQPAAAIGSLLTGQYPLTHKLHRSFDTLDKDISLVTEAALKKGYKTGFFGGNPHILKKTGLSKYFDTFDDSAASHYTAEIIKDFNISAEQFIQWREENMNQPFFALITNSEFDALNDQDTNYTSYDKMDEKLFHFFLRLKQKNIWDNSYIYFVSLKGSNNYNRSEETPFLNLHSENTMITALVKPPRMKGDEGISWKNDIPINLADIGYTLKKFFNLDDPSKIDLLPTLDISLFLDTKFDENTPLRPLLVESANTWIKSPLELNFSIIYGNHLMTEKNGNPEIYNLTTDRFEVVNVYSKSENGLQKLKSIQQKMRKIFPSQIFYLTDYYNIQITKEFLKKSNLKELFSHSPPDKFNPVYIYYINNMIRSKDMSNILLKELDKPFDICINLLSKSDIVLNDLKYCKDPLLVEYVRYKKYNLLNLNQEKAKLSYDIKRKRFYDEIKISIWNLANENIWGIFQKNKVWYHPLVYLDPNFSTGLNQ
ncbi:MAG: hypothetical protein ACK41T_11545 [Pseudobdellovibrio sp.]